MKTRPPHSARGSALLTVILLTTVLCTLIASILGLALAERRLNHRDALRLEARYAAEAAAEYGISQIRQKYASRSVIDVSPTGSDALKTPPVSFWKGSNVATSTVEVIGGTPTNVTTGSNALYFISRADPANASDPDVGKWVQRRDVPVLAKATVTPPNGGPAITSYVLEKLAVRAIPLFSHAIFYNMDMEISPGANMNIYGPVHVNGDIYAGSMYGAALNFRGQVTLSGEIYHGWKNTDALTHGAGNESYDKNAPMSFLSSNGTLLAMKGNYTYTNASGQSVTVNQWNDSSMGGSDLSTPSLTANSAFRDFATDRWNGYLQTSTHGITDYNPPAIGAYQEDTDVADSVDTSNNAAHQIIEPSNWPSSVDPDYNAKVAVEQEKYANNAGVYLTVNPTTGTITASSRSKNSTIPKTLTSLPSGLVTWRAYAATVNSKTGVTTVTNGMYDERRQLGVNLVEIDMGKLKTAVAEMATPSDSTKAIGNLSTSDWTGIVYIEISGGPTTSVDLSATTNIDEEGQTIAATNSNASKTAVRLINATGSVASYGTANPGLTIATNAPLYVKGNYNADGSIQESTANPTQSSANKAETGEVPAALVADAITFLSAGFDDSTSKALPTVTAPTASTNTIEIAAALLMGATPTDKNDSNGYSGGVQNFPRFLENWQGKSVWIRGSLVNLFESRVASEKWRYTKSSGIYVFRPPNRCWGFNSLFRDGIYPPGTPKVMNFRRVSFTDLTAAQYNTLKSSFGW